MIPSFLSKMVVIKQKSIDISKYLVLLIVTFPLPKSKHSFGNVSANRADTFKLLHKLRKV